MLCLLLRLTPCSYCANIILCAVPVAGATDAGPALERIGLPGRLMVTLTTLLSVPTVSMAVLPQSLSGILPL